MKPCFAASGEPGQEKAACLLTWDGLPYRFVRSITEFQGDFQMQWTKPEFTEISLNMEVTAYVATDDASEPGTEKRTEEDKSVSSSR